CCHHHQTNPHQKSDANDSGTEVSTALGLSLENSWDLPLHHEWTKPPVLLLLRFPEVGIISVGVLDLFASDTENECDRVQVGHIHGEIGRASCRERVYI